MAKFRADDGQALVELAFVIPLVLLFLFGIIDFGLALNRQNSTTDLANLVARQVSVMGTTTSASCGGTTYTTLSSWVNCEANAVGVPTTNLSVCVGDVSGSTPSSTYTQGDPVEAEVRSPFGWLSILSSSDSYIGSVVSPTTTVGGNATMRWEASGTTTSPTFLGSACSS